MANLTTNAKSRLRGVVFDMDGTLTVPVIDFAAMYRSVLGEDEYKRIKAESPTGIDILHHIESWSADKQQKAYETIADFEKQGIDKLQIMPGTVYNWLKIETLVVLQLIKIETLKKITFFFWIL